MIVRSVADARTLSAQVVNVDAAATAA
jgi:hypothetical protein